MTFRKAIQILGRRKTFLENRVADRIAENGGKEIAFQADDHDSIRFHRDRAEARAIEVVLREALGAE